MRLQVLLALLVTLAVTSPARAIAPPYVPDGELASRPVVVLAHWARAPLKPHSRVSGNLLEEHEVRSRLVVDRVLKGDLKAGEHPLLLGFGFGWDKHGKNFQTYTSTQVRAEVDDVTRQAMWFLSYRQSWDKKDKTRYLHLDSYRGIQNARLEPYFHVLMRPDRNSAVADLLEHQDPFVVFRALHFIHVGRPAWPFKNFDTDFLNPRDPKVQPLVQHAARIADVIPRLKPEIRPHAVSVYASLVGKRCLPVMRGLLKDGDPAVRGVAVGTLCRYRDRPSVAVFASALKGLKDSMLALQVIQRLESWGVEELVPALISFLDCDESLGYFGEDLLIPSVQANKVLFKITGYHFPREARESLDAWSAASKAEGIVAKRAILIGKLGKNRPAVAARLENRKGLAVVVTNVSQRVIVIGETAEDRGGWGRHLAIWMKPGRLRRLKPGESLRIPISQNRSSQRITRKVRLIHLVSNEPASQEGIRAWLGVIPVTFRK